MVGFWGSYLHLHFVVAKAQMLQIGRSICLDGWELVLQHVNDLWQLRITPGKLPTRKRHSVMEEAEEGHISQRRKSSAKAGMRSYKNLNVIYLKIIFPNQCMQRLKCL